MSSRGSLRSVWEAFGAGATSLTDISERTGLSRDLVDLAVERLIALGRLEADALSSGCPTGGCGTCSSGSSDGAPGCGSPRTAGQGPVPLVLRVRRD